MQNLVIITLFGPLEGVCVCVCVGVYSSNVM